MYFLVCSIYSCPGCTLLIICNHFISSPFQACGTDHPALFTTTLFTEPVYWIYNGHPPSQLYTQGQLECQFRFESQTPLAECVLTTHDINPWHSSPSSSGMIISLAKPLRAVTPGQVSSRVECNIQLTIDAHM